jgi:hypothetical protein
MLPQPDSGCIPFSQDAPRNVILVASRGQCQVCRQSQRIDAHHRATK